MRITLLFVVSLFVSGCSSTYVNQDVTGKLFPAVNGESLEKKAVSIPDDFNHDFTLLLIGYKQNAQFDIDRWLIGLDMTKTDVAAYEIPTIQGLFPRMFKPFIDNGMRAGIPKQLWKGVITVYKDGDRVQQFTGNQSPNNARVVLLNNKKQIIYFYDDGFSVEALNNLRALL
ncbi:hypothetical protein [Algibacillus agarilyticus]|uniref:hypothetical protein n=1 Tax=Algibacillus agarilyticus TaxID=2234133 RepID=UPI000DD024D9|nr:hypothetical protein [Algibacillus agarilyticus]